MTTPSAAVKDMAVATEVRIAETSANDLKKKPIDEALKSEMPDISISAGNLRGVLNKDGLVVKNIDKNETRDDAPLAAAFATPPAPAHDEEDAFFARPVQLPQMELPKWVKPTQAVALGVTAAWLLLSAAVLLWNGHVFSMLPHELGGVFAGVLAPVALLWLALTHITRTHDAQRYGEALRAELHALIFPSEDRQQRISHDIEKLCQQAAELSTSSRTVLKAIQRARQALNTEVKDFVALTEKAEGHVDTLTEGLSTRILKLNDLTSEIEKRTENIDSKTKEGAQAWDDTTVHVLKKAAEIEESLGRGADKILEAAEKAQSKTIDIESQLNGTFDKLSGSIDKVAERLTGLSSEFDGHGNNLSRATERVVDETSRLGQIIETQVQDLEGMTSGVFEAIAKSSEMVKEQRQTLDESAAAMTRQVEDITGRIKASAAVLDEAAGSVVTRTGDIESRMTRQTDQLRDVLADMEHQAQSVENSGAAVANRLSEALSVALSGAETLSGAARRAVESLEKAAAETRMQAGDIIKSTIDSVTALQDTGAAQMSRVERIFAKLGDSREQLIESARRAEDQAKSVLQMYEDQTVAVGLAVTTLVEKLASANTNLEVPLKSVETAVLEADRRHEQIEQTLVRRVEDLSRASDKARDTAEQIQTMLRGQAQDMSVLSGQIAGQVRSIGEQIGLQKDALSSHAERAVTDLSRAQTAIERQVESLQTVAASMSDDLTRLHDKVTDKTGTLTREAETASERLRSVDTQIEESTERLEDQTERLRTALENAGKAVDGTIDHAEPLYRRAIDQAATAQDRMEQMNRSFETTSGSNLERLQQIGIIFDERLTQLRTGVTEAAQILRASSDELRLRVDDIDTATMSASERMQGVSKNLNNQITDIHLITDQALIKVDAVQKSIEGQFHELNAAVGKAVAEISGAQTQFAETTKAIDGAAEVVVRKIQGVARETVGESSILQNAAASVVKTTQDMIANLQSESRGMLQAANEALMDVKKMGDSFALRAREVEEHMKSSLSTSQAYTRDLKAQTTAIADASVDTTEKISKSVSQLSTKIAEVEKAALSMGDKVEQVRGKLDNETGRFMATAKQAIDAAEDASSAYVRQSNVLFKAAQDAGAQVEKIRDVHWRAQRDTFLASAKFVIESLHSLSVDFVRVLEGEVQDKTWKAFQKGDVAAFTRRLVAEPQNLPQEKIRTKFSNDSEFRSYVQRFIRLFEELFDQAQLNDHGEILAATFLSSDIGKLYQILCTATGRDAKQGRDLTRAA